jgi:hypothetical protein
MRNTVTARADLLMLSGVTATCTDCGDQRLMVPVDDAGTGAEFCCTSCDAAVWLPALVDPVDPVLRRSADRVA